MKDIKKTIADNLIALRKERGLTQNDLAERINYSDNMVSRWERAEIAPSVETLAKISEIYDIPIETLMRENATQTARENNKVNKVRILAIALLWVVSVWFISTIIFFYVTTFFRSIPWQIFILDIPLSCLIMLAFSKHFGRIYTFVIASVLVWSTLAYIYLQFIAYNIFLVFIVGVPVQLALVIWAFIKPKSKNSRD